jgi:hypothetical protein
LINGFFPLMCFAGKWSNNNRLCTFMDSWVTFGNSWVSYNSWVSSKLPSSKFITSIFAGY